MRTSHSLIFFMLVFAGGAVHAQDPGSTANSAAIQAYLDAQARNASPYDSMARMQVSVQYGDFLDSLGGSPQHRAQAEETLVAVIAARAEMSNAAVSGGATPEQLREVSSYDYLRAQMATVLNSTELQMLDTRQEGMAEEQLRKTYGEQMTQIIPQLTAANRDMVLDILVKHMSFQEDDASSRGRMSAEELVQQQLLSLMDARMELQGKFQGEQQDMVDYFLNDLRSNLFLNQSMSEGSQQ